MDIVTAITGASGALYAARFIQGLVQAGVNVHLVVSPLGRRLLHDEMGMETVDLPTLAGTKDGTVELDNVTVWSVKPELQPEWAKTRALLPKPEPAVVKTTAPKKKKA